MQSSFSCIGKGDWEREELKGRVRSVRIESVRTMDERNYTKAKSNTFRQVITFLPSGKKAEEVHYNPDGTLASRESFTYDDDGALLERRVGEQEGPARMHWTYTYEDAGRLVLETHTGEEAQIGGKEVYYFDDRGRKVEDRSYDLDGELQQLGKFEYEDVEEGTRLTWSVLNPLEEVVKKRIYFYDKQGNLLEKEVHTPFGALESRETFQYDENGWVVESNHYQANGELHYQYIYQYRLDGQGNWIEKKTLARFDVDNQKDELAVEVCRREIEYFEQ